MARYIDLEELERRIKKHVKPEIPEEKAFVEYYKDECIRQGYAMPTADVVPKTEVVAMMQWVELLKSQLTEARRKTEVEVAREIFEDIERKIKALLTLHLEEINKEYIKDTPLYDRHSGIIFALQGMADFIAELKKKYTERCTDCKHFVGCECFDGKTCDEYKEGEK
jgi:hypothetical protein